MRAALCALATLLLAAVPLVLAGTVAWPDDRWLGAAIYALGTASWVGVGLYATWRRPQNRLGLLMVAVGLSYWAGAAGLVDGRIVFTAGLLLSGVFIAPLVHMLVAYPSGRVQRPDVVLVRATYAFIVSASVLPVALDARGLIDESGSPGNAFAVVHAPELGHALYAVSEVVALALAIRLVFLLSARLRAATPARRRAMTPVLSCGVVLLVALALDVLLDLVGVPDAVVDCVDLLAAATFLVLPFTFLAGLARTRWFRAGALGGLVERLNAPQRPELRAALAEALGDDDLALVFWHERDGRWIDDTGRAVDEAALRAGGRALAPVERESRRVGAIVCDPALLEDPELTGAAVAAAALALDNARLEAELRARVEELETSRRKLVEAGLAERRRLERDLHDGAQQRLVALGLQVSMARARLESDPAAAGELLDIARSELRETQEELRELARGIHPAILTDRGLGPAVASLVERATVPVEIGAMPEARLPGPVEAVAYFVVAETLTNVAKHAPRARAQVSVSQDDGHAIVSVSDNGPGGARDDDGGSGLRGLADRLAAVDGRLSIDSAAGRGTTIRAEIPCAAVAA